MGISRFGALTIVASAALLLAGCGGDGSNLIEGDETINIPGGTGGGGGGDAGGGGGDAGGAGGGVTTPTGAFFDIGGFLQNEDIHPLQDNIDPTDGTAADITPATVAADGTAGCPDGTAESGNTVTLFDDGMFFEGGTTNPVFPICLINGNFVAVDGAATTYDLDNQHVYVLTVPALIGNGGVLDTAPADAPDVTLNIAAGTQIYAVAGQQASLRATRGSTINISGTADQPVMMSAVEATATGSISGDPTDLTGRGDWGGLVVDGYAATNGEDAGDGGDGSNDVPNELLSEAAPTGQTNVFFGGGDDDDNSGTITFLTIGESGVTFRPDAELQGLTLEAVGSGTTIENVQVFGSDDDGIEWFGGTVDVSNIVINGMTDDGLDIDQGYTGTIDTAIVRQGSDLGDRTSEADGNGDAFDATPVTRPIIANVLFLGDGDDESEGLRMREGYGATFENIVVVDGNAISSAAASATFANGCFGNADEVDRELTALGIAYFCVNGVDANPDGGLFTVWSAGSFDEDGGDDTGTGENPAGFNATEDETISVDPNTLVVTTAATPNSSVTVAGDYYGAVDPSSTTPFFAGWTVSVANSGDAVTDAGDDGTDGGTTSP